MEQMTPRGRLVEEITPAKALEPIKRVRQRKREREIPLKSGTLAWHNVEYCNGYRRHSVRLSL
jgi:hypothetical protein